MHRIFAVLSVALLVGAPALAGSAARAAELVRGPTTEQIIEGLTPHAPVKFRGISTEDPTSETPPPTRESGGQDSPTTPAAAPQPALPSMDFLVHFAFGSAELTPEARDLLDRLGAALQSDDLRPFSFRLVGHTDAIGSVESNLKLSRERADAVKTYLVTTFKIAPQRLETLGLGKSQLIDPANPDGAVNRRVQVVNLGSAPKTE
ncbi:MAG TPA: OmpA family protein [Stellaceae bacterium]|nr:OmpA family protein [Stellaceae bacterium]